MYTLHVNLQLDSDIINAVSMHKHLLLKSESDSELFDTDIDDYVCTQCLQAANSGCTC